MKTRMFLRLFGLIGKGRRTGDMKNCAISNCSSK